MTIGTDRVRVQFNPSGESLVDKIKWKTAELIDICNDQQREAGMQGETLRLWALAMTHYEDAAMWAVKAATAATVKVIDPAVKEYPADHPASGDLGSVPL